MRVVTIREFIKLETGTVYCDGADFILVGMKVKLTSYGDDHAFRYRKLFKTKNTMTGPLLEEDHSYHVEFYSSMEVYTNSKEFTVLSKDDLKFLIRQIQGCLNNSTPSTEE